MRFRPTALLAALALLAAAGVARAAPPDGPLPERPNVLFLAIDDLRPEIGPYGGRAKTPNLDRLAARGLVFDRAYCQQALCAPSRSSLMSGRRPGIPGVNAADSTDEAQIQEAMKQVQSLPEVLKAAGYATLNVGKVFHTYETSGNDPWTARLKPGGGGYQLERNLERERTFAQKLREEGPKARWKYPRGDASESADTPDDAYQTHRITDNAIKLLDEQRAKDPGQPVFWAVGYFKPHVPYIAPQKYWDLYDRDAIAVPPRDEPAGAAEYALVPQWYEMRMYGDIPRDAKNLGDDKTRELIHGYLACVSFVDAQVGRLVDALDARGMADDTVVVLWSDHGYKLGDYGDWSKYTNMELDARVPLVVAGPGVATGRTAALVELIDLYPTVLGLAGVDAPAHLEGTSFVPLLREPGRKWKAGALSYYDRHNPEGEGFSITDGTLRYTEWREYGTGKVLARELYDHSQGPVAERNLVDDPARAADVERLAGLLAGGWRGLVPKGE